MTVKDLLTMASGQEHDPTDAIVTESNWTKTFLATPVVKEPGSEFRYNSMATFMLSAIVQKVTGEKVIDYLQPRLFRPLGINGIDWEVNPQGINTGGWGLRLRTEDMAKFGQLYLQNGIWNNKQVIPSEWVKEATTAKIDQAPDAPQSKKDSSDWMQGYCYQFWRCRNNAFRADGAYGQYIIVLPDKDAVIAITSETSDMQNELNMVWKYLLPAIKDGPLPENKTSSEKLKHKLSSLALPMPVKSTDSPIIKSISQKIFTLGSNDQKFDAISFKFSDDVCNVYLKAGSQNYSFAFGSAKWITGETTLAGPDLIRRPGALSTSKTAGSYSWKDDNTLELVLRYIESPHSLIITCRFEKDNLEVNFHVSRSPGYDLKPIKGVMAKL